MNRKRSFTLAEVFISLIIVGGAFALFLPAIKGTTDSYRILRMKGTCQYIADEYFATTVLDCLSNQMPEGIENFSKEDIVTIDHIPYLVKIDLQPEEKEADDEEKEDIRVQLNIAVMPHMVDEKNKLDSQAIRKTTLCVHTQK